MLTRTSAIYFKNFLTINLSRWYRDRGRDQAGCEMIRRLGCTKSANYTFLSCLRSAPPNMCTPNKHSAHAKECCILHEVSTLKEHSHGPCSSITFLKSRFPYPGVLVVSNRTADWNVRQIHVASCRIPIAAKHRVDRLWKLCAAWFVHTASIHPEVFQAIAGSLPCAEAKFFVSSFCLPRANC